MASYLLQNSEGRYFTHPQQDTNAEWSADITQARSWADLDRCLDAAKVWQLLYGITLTVIEKPRDYPVTSTSLV